MLTVPDCDCGYCTGMARLVPYEIVDCAGIVLAAKSDRVTIKPTDQCFAIDKARAVACVRMIRRRLARLCGCWVDEAYRGQGIGRELVLARIAFIENHTSAKAIDTYAFNSQLFESLGFTARQSYKIGTTLLRKVIS